MQLKKNLVNTMLPPTTNKLLVKIINEQNDLKTLDNLFNTFFSTIGKKLADNLDNEIQYLSKLLIQPRFPIYLSKAT